MKNVCQVYLPVICPRCMWLNPTGFMCRPEDCPYHGPFTCMEPTPDLIDKLFSKWVMTLSLTYKLSIMESTRFPNTQEMVIIMGTLHTLDNLADELLDHALALYQLYLGSSLDVVDIVNIIFDDADSISDIYMSIRKKVSCMAIADMWEMEVDGYENGIQWLPREMVDDVMELVWAN